MCPDVTADDGDEQQVDDVTAEQESGVRSAAEEDEVQEQEVVAAAAGDNSARGQSMRPHCPIHQQLPVIMYRVLLCIHTYVIQ